MSKHRLMKFQNSLCHQWGKSNQCMKQIENRRMRSKLKKITNKEIKEVF